MKELEKPIGRVYRRMRVQRFLTALVWSWAVALAAAAVALGVDRFGYPVPGPDWLPLAIAGGVGLAVAFVISLIGGPNRVDAAVAIDRAFGLNERLGTTLTLPAELRETSAGRALIADTIRHLKDLDIPEKFPLALPRRSWVPLLPALIAAGLIFVPTWVDKAAKARSADTTLDKEVVSEQTKALSKKIASKRQDMVDKQKFAETEKLLAQIEKAAEEMSKAPPAAKDKALMELNKLTNAIQERQKQIGSPEQVARQLQQLKELANAGPAEQLAKDLAKGDFQKAAMEMKKLQEKLNSGKMSEAEKKALKDQLGEMKKQLEQVANLEQRKKQLEEAKKNGGLSQEQFDREMAKLNEQSKNLQQVKDLAKKLEQAQQAMAKGDMQKAAAALGMTKDQLKEMAEKLQELETLDGAMAELQDAKNGMTGEGMNQLGETLGSMGRDSRNRMGGQGGRGRGEGDRAEAKDDTALFNTKVKQQIGKGKAVFEGFAPPTAQMKGTSTIEVQGELETSAGLGADALTNQKVPKNVEKHIRGYFDRINKGSQ